MKKSKHPTVLTISDLAGVSPSTVSRALNDDARISQEVRAKVQRIAKEQGYTPNALARSLVSRTSGVVGLVLGNLNNPFYAELAEIIHARIALMGKRLMLLHIGGEQLDMESMQTVFQYQMDGCIVTSASMSSKVAEICERYRLPMVMINRVAQLHSCAVSCHNYDGGYWIADALLAAGHRKLAAVGGRPNTSTSQNREAGFLECMSQRGVEPWARYCGHSTYDGGYKAGCEILSAKEHPDAIFAINDIMALGVLDAAREFGVKVPDDISVVGFDDIRAASWAGYNLTTIAQPVEAMVERALDLLFARMSDPTLAGEEHYIRGEFRIRGTARLGSELVLAGSEAGRG